MVVLPPQAYCKGEGGLNFCCHIDKAKRQVLLRAATRAGNLAVSRPVPWNKQAPLGLRLVLLVRQWL